MQPGKASPRFFVDPHGQVPSYAQLKDQIKLARTFRGLGPGDVLPSIRALARQVGVGDGVVRRAYRELCEVGLLRTDRRKHVIVTPARPIPPEADALAQAGAEQVDRLIAWAGEARLSAISLGRLLLARAFARESASASYVFVDICRVAAEEGALKIAKAWDIKVAGILIADFANRSSAAVRGLSAVLVSENLHEHEDVAKMVGEGTPSVFAVKMRVAKGLRQRISKLASRSRVLIVCPNESSPLGNKTLRRHYEHLFGQKPRFQAKTLDEIPDLPAMIRSRRYPLVVLSPVVWEQVPVKIKRMGRVVLLTTEPDPHSLEEVRVAAGVLL